MFSDTLPDLDTVKTYYNIPFSTYSIVMFHPVTTEAAAMDFYAEAFVKALIKSGHNYVQVPATGKDCMSSHQIHPTRGSERETIRKNQDGKRS